MAAENSNSRRSSGGRPPRSGSKGGGGGPRSAASAPRNPAMELNPCTDIPDIKTFTEWELGDDVQKAIADMGIVKPTPIQCLTIGPVLKRKDVIAKAETGTGKTLAFGAGMMAKLENDRSTVLGLVLCPTRELASQVHDVLAALGESRGLTSALIVGGEPAQPQVRALQNGAQLVVGTPGRVMDLYKQGFLSFPWTEFVVLDEADEMLEIGFIDDIKKILSYTPDERTTLLFSATFPPALLKLAREYTTDPLEIATSKGVATVDHIKQNFIKASDEDKWLALLRLIENSDPKDVFLIFGDRRTDVDQLIRRMERMPFSAKALHGGYDQASRFRVMTAFRTGDVKCLVATDVASRGLDVKHVSHVVNFGVPRDVSIYTHRIGRTGRAGAKGNAITFVSPRDMRRWNEVSGAMNWDVDEMPIPERAARGGGGRGRGRDDRGERDGRGGRSERGGRGRDDRGERGRSERSSEDRKPRRRSEGRDERPERKDEERAPREVQPERKIVRRRSAHRNAEAAQQTEAPRAAEATQRNDSNDEPRPKRVRTRTRTRSDQPKQEERQQNDDSRAPRKDDERKPRQERERKPRRTEESQPRQERERKPRRTEESKPSQEQPAKPKRERKPKPTAAPAAPAAPGGFGAGLVDEAPKPKPKRKRASKPKAAKPEPKPEPKTEPKPTSGGGFGAGV